MERRCDALERVSNRIKKAWSLSDQVFALLKPTAWYERPIPLRHPFVFYLGHLPAFALNQLKATGFAESEDAALEQLFERGIDPLSISAADARQIDAWPQLDEIEAFRDRVRERVMAAQDPAATTVLHLILEHELMYVETLLYMLQQLSPAHKNVVERPTKTAGSVDVVWVEVPAGTAHLGGRAGEAPFFWDNELPPIDVPVEGFRVQSHPVTNRDYNEFVEADGYVDPAWWKPEDWTWLRSSQIVRPVNWLGDGAQLEVRGVLSDVPFESASNWPVQVSFAEANAYARWRGARLMTETEFVHVAFADGRKIGDGHLDLRSWGTQPVGQHEPNFLGVYDLFGNAWEWTSTRFRPFPGFKVTAPSYPGYSVDFFDDRHRVLLGGSWATSSELLRPSFRNWFQEHYPYVFAQFRLAVARHLPPKIGDPPLN